MASSFDPKQYLTKLGTNKDGTPRMYLPTASRVLWFRTDNPAGSITTELVQVEPFPVFRAVITNGEGVLLATAYGSALPKAGAVWAGREIEKAETAAIGRALGHAGYGTQFDGEDDTDHLADSPVERKPAPKVTPKPSAKNVPQVFNKETATAFTNYWFTSPEMLEYADIQNALNVKDILQWRGESIEQAHAIVKQWCVDNPAPAEDKTA
jgi:hypothetical protein